ncbi:hypothetical protein [Demequina sp. NBRC 110057]|nr:hypothetical protein [Demequina sp. NBRC 110057]
MTLDAGGTVAATALIDDAGSAPRAAATRVMPRPHPVRKEDQQ